MSNLTDKQRAFIQAKVDGVPNREAALLAGFAEGGADATASRLMKRADVQKAIKAGKKADGVDTRDDKPLMLPKYGSSLELLQHLYNNPKAPAGLRFEAAKQALPYEHAKLGEQGKKAAAKETAKGKASAGKFKKKAPPRLSSHTMN